MLKVMTSICHPLHISIYLMCIFSQLCVSWLFVHIMLILEES